MIQPSKPLRYNPAIELFIFALYGFASFFSTTGKIRKFVTV